jgi:tetratricopeptide (TPR) repeat protein
MPPALATALRQLPLALVWVVAAWPVALWLVHAQEPAAAVRLVQGAAAAFAASWPWAVGGLVGACVVYPPAPAFLRRALHRFRLGVMFDQQGLLKVLADLEQFETATRHLEAGRMLRVARKHEQAIPHLARAVELDESIAGAWHQLGLALFTLHQWPAAARSFERAENLDPGHAFGDAMLCFGRCLHEIKDGRALLALETHARQHGGGPRSWLWLAEARARAGDAGGALAALRQAAAKPTVKLSPEDAWFRALARVRLWGKGRPA